MSERNEVTREIRVSKKEKKKKRKSRRGRSEREARREHYLVPKGDQVGRCARHHEGGEDAQEALSF